ncbi:MAG: hypothetical protein Q9183_006164, partial [Haloplaca sp. 2 TL-2023]
MILLYGQHLRKATFALSALFSYCFIQQLWAPYDFSSKFPTKPSPTTNTSPAESHSDAPLEDFPKRMWTTGPLSPTRLKKVDAEHVRTWMDQNQDHRWELLTDGAAETYVKDNFTPNDKISITYVALQDFIMRADLIRYLVLLKDGGVYNDVDVGCLKPIDLWIPQHLKDNTSVVLGIEVDNEMGPNKSPIFELVNWTILARRNAPFMRFLVDRVIANLEQSAANHNTTLHNLNPKRQEVIDVTGPMALTQAAFAYMSQRTGTMVNMHNFTKMRRPKLVADILVMPINAFGAGHQVSWSGADEDGSALVHHYFAGSWKTTHFDGPTEEEKKAAEEIKKAEEEQKRRAEEEEQKKKAEEEQKKQAEEEEKRKQTEAERTNLDQQKTTSPDQNQQKPQPPPQQQQQQPPNDAAMHQDQPPRQRQQQAAAPQTQQPQNVPPPDEQAPVDTDEDLTASLEDNLFSLDDLAALSEEEIQELEKAAIREMEKQKEMGNMDK